MNHEKSIIDTPSLAATHVRSKAKPPVTSKSGFAVHHYRDGALLKTSKSGQIDAHLVCLLQPKAAQAESYFRLRHAVEAMRKPEGGIVIGVTSPGEGDGKSLTAINLAGALAQDAAARILLVDLNLRESSADVRSHFELQQEANSGVADWIENAESTTTMTTYHLPDFNLSLMPSGTSAESPYELLKSPRLDELFDEARQRYDYIVVDTPQTLLLPDVELIERVVDGFLIVIKADSTTHKKLEEMLNHMAQEKVLGLVFNGTPAPG